MPSGSGTSDDRLTRQVAPGKMHGAADASRSNRLIERRSSDVKAPQGDLMFAISVSLLILSPSALVLRPWSSFVIRSVQVRHRESHSTARMVPRVEGLQLRER
jgi:hypothetical protein